MLDQLNDQQFLQYFIAPDLYPKPDQENEKLKGIYQEYRERFIALVNKAEKLLDQQELIQCYEVALYLQANIKLKAKIYPLWIEAYRQYLKSFYMVLSEREIFTGLFCYGIDQFSLSKPVYIFAEYETLRKLYTRLNNYTSIRGHFKKLEFFEQHQHLAEYMWQCLEQSNQDDTYKDNWSPTLDLLFRGVTLILLFHPQFQTQFLQKYLQRKYQVFDQEEDRIISLYCQKMLAQYGEDIFTPEARIYVNQLIEMEQVKRRASATFAWKTHLSLDLPLDDWGVSIWTDFCENRGYLHVELQDDAQFNWSISLYDRYLDRRHCESKFYTSTNPNRVLDIPYFADDGLIQLPTWLKRLEVYGYQIDWTTLKITGLKKKADKQKVMKWLKSASVFS